MRFDTRPHRTSYSDPRSRRQLLGLTLLLGMVVIGGRWASDPANWRWLTELQAPVEQPAPPREAPPALTEEDETLPQDVFRVVPGEAPAATRPESSPPGKDPAGPGKPESADNLESSPQKNDAPAASPSATAPPPGQSTEVLDLRIPAELLKSVRDTNIGIRHDESEAYFTMLARARDVPLRVIESAARTDVSHLELTNDPERYRGQVLTLAGELRRFNPIPTGKNSLGLDRLYEGWLFTDEAGRSNPYRIVCTSVPEGFPQGNEIRTRVRFTGFFFKRFGYATPGGLHFAPLLLGKRVRWTPPAPVQSIETTYAPYLAVALAIVGLGFGSVCWFYTASDRRQHTQRVRQVTQPTSADFDHLQEFEPVDVVSVLNRISEMEQDTPDGDDSQPDLDNDESASRTDPVN